MLNIITVAINCRFNSDNPFLPDLNEWWKKVSFQLYLKLLAFLYYWYILCTTPNLFEINLQIIEALIPVLLARAWQYLAFALFMCL